MTEKSRLQEYCQKNKLSMPNYESRSKGPPHKLEWDARVTVKIKGEDIVAESIVSTNSKGSAEKQAAAIMLDMIKSKSKQNFMESRLLKLKKTMIKQRINMYSEIIHPMHRPKHRPKHLPKKSVKKNLTHLIYWNPRIPKQQVMPEALISSIIPDPIYCPNHLKNVYHLRLMIWRLSL